MLRSQFIIMLMIAALTSGFAQPSKPTMRLKVDHAGICAYDLQSIQQAFAEAGLRAEYGGAHATGGTHNALLGFDDGSYIELIAPQHPETLSGADTREWSSLKPDKAGDCFWAVGSADIKTDVEKLRQAGIDITDPALGSRKKPDGTVLQWQTANVKPDKGGDILPFFIEDKTPRSARIQPSASVKGTELVGIDIVVLGVKDLDASIALFRQAYRLTAPTLATDSTFGAKLAYFSGTPVLLATPLDKNSWLASRLAQSGQGPVGLLLGTKDFATSHKRFQISTETSWFGRKVAWLDADKLHGARLGIVQ